jgi:hypothetical protein
VPGWDDLGRIKFVPYKDPKSPRAVETRRSSARRRYAVRREEITAKKRKDRTDPAKREAVLAIERRYETKRARTSQAVRERGWALKFGLSPADVQRMLDESGGGCHACGAIFDLEAFNKAATPHIDHDRSHCPGHKSCGKCIRGLLCDRCNRAIGLFRDDPDTLRRAAAWLETAKADVRARVNGMPAQAELPLNVTRLERRA